MQLYDRACDDNLSHGARDSSLNRGCGAQLVFVLFLMAISKVGATPGRPSAPSTTAVAGAVPWEIEDIHVYGCVHATVIAKRSNHT